METIGCTETSVPHMLRRIPRERTTHLERGGSLKSHVVVNMLKEVVLSA